MIYSIMESIDMEKDRKNEAQIPYRSVEMFNCELWLRLKMYTFIVQQKFLGNMDTSLKN
jgi:hypothetical protein